MTLVRCAAAAVRASSAAVVLRRVGHPPREQGSEPSWPAVYAAVLRASDRPKRSCSLRYMRTGREASACALTAMQAVLQAFASES